MLLGERVGAAIVSAAPVTVRVSVPELVAVLLWPLELAHAGGVPLAARGDVTFVYDIAPRLAAAGAEGAGCRGGAAGAGGVLPADRGPACWRCGGSGTR